MTRVLTRMLPLFLMLLMTACTGSTAPGDLGPDTPDGLSELDYELVTDPDSSISSSDVEGWLTSADDAVNAREFSSAASQAGNLEGFVFIQGMYFEPSSPPGSGFSGRLSVRIQNGAFANNTFNNVLLFLFWVDPATRELVQLDSSRGRSGNWFDFDINALGHMVIAENTNIPRPAESFRVSAFADQSATGTGVDINFYAIPENGTEPVSYSWDMGDGTQLNGQSVSHSYAFPGSYNVTLNAVDGSGSVAPTISTPIEISSSAPPLEDLQGESIPSTGDELTFTFSATVVGGKAPYTYEWDFDGDGSVDSTDPPPVDFTFDDYGFYVGTVKITDSFGDSITAEIVSDARRIDLSVDSTTADLGSAFNFTVEGFGLEPADDVLADMDDGNILTNPGSTFSYTHSLPGTYVARAMAVRVHDGTEYTVESNQLTLTVFATPKPEITSFTPAEAPIGGRVVITGLFFGTQDGTDTVLINDLDMAVTSWSDTQIEVTVPQGAVDGPLTVIADGRSSDPSSVLNVIPGPPDNPDGRQQ